MASHMHENDIKTEQYRKLFIGGLTLNTTESMLSDFYGQWGNLVDCVVMKDRKTGRSRGFGFVTFDNESCVDDTQNNRPHVIDNRTVEAKRAMPREESTKPDSHLTVNRLFVGNLKKDTTNDDLKRYFEQFGAIKEADIMTWKETGESRGFGFVTFEDYDPVDKVVLFSPHQINNSNVNVKKALSKEQVNAQKRVDRPGRDEGFRRERRDDYPQRSRGGGGGAPGPSGGRAYFDRYEDRFAGPPRFNEYREDPYMHHAPAFDNYEYPEFGYYGGGYNAGGPMKNDYYDFPQRSRGAAAGPYSRPGGRGGGGSGSAAGGGGGGGGMGRR